MAVKLLLPVLVAVAALASCGRQPAAEPAEPAGGAAVAPAATAAPAAPAPGPGATATAAQDECQQVESQAEMTKCWGEAARAADGRAAGAFRTTADWLRQREQTDVLRMLEESQSRWEGYRDAHCATVAGIYDGGSVAPMQEAHCRARLAAGRQRELETMMSDAAN